MKSARKHKVIILGSDHPTGLGTARALCGLPVDVIGFCHDPKHECCRSRCFSQVIRIADEGKECLFHLIELGRRESEKPMILPAKDSMVQLLSENREELEKYFLFVLPEKPVVDLLMDKTVFHQWAFDRGFPVPESKIVRTPAELDSAVEEIGFPVILKPLYRTMEWDKQSPSHKIYKLHNRRDLEEIPFELFRVADRYLVQEWIPGKDGNIHFCLVYFDRDGREIGSFAGKKILQWRIGTGNTAVCIGTENEKIRCLTREILQSANFRGLGSMEFKRSEKDDLYYIIEPTIGRNDLQSYVAVTGGVNLTRLAFLDAFGIGDEHRMEPARKAAWLEEKHVYYAIKHLRKTNEFRLSRLIADIRKEGSLSCAYWDRRDPLPFLFMLKKMIGRKIKKDILSG